MSEHHQREKRGSLVLEHGVSQSSSILWAANSYRLRSRGDVRRHVQCQTPSETQTDRRTDTRILVHFSLKM